MSDSEHPGPRHTILLLEDEPVSAEYLGAALAPLGVAVYQAGSLTQARALLRQQRFSLLLLDLSLPDGSGGELLGEIRANPDSPSHVAPALALTAELDEPRRAALRVAGFAEALAKPISARALREAVRCMLGDTRPQLSSEAEGRNGTSTIWDEAAALSACGGSSEVLTALRGLFLKELPDQCAKVRSGLQSGQFKESLDELHRLLAGCGFCGASELAGSARVLMHRVRDEADFRQAMVGFEAAVLRVLDTRLSD